ncbi:hypothetical protein SAMN02745161_1314 [Halodesulfovibrio marinisediminis DSM 17456]|uniref:Uncharacterized protein n=1 Tax=Halodesulfovibrio marinisediminis DSM 17456 TaxID=1121457 RepID=A0A1N6FHE5_9BACT|nr:hypothetical protein SAMN02745161_1314 [Halodesulfovibrio marinisediminis DSM 17456]
MPYMAKFSVMSSTTISMPRFFYRLATSPLSYLKDNNSKFNTVITRCIKNISLRTQSYISSKISILDSDCFPTSQGRSHCSRQLTDVIHR